MPNRTTHGEPISFVLALIVAILLSPETLAGDLSPAPVCGARRYPFEIQVADWPQARSLADIDGNGEVDLVTVSQRDENHSQLNVYRDLDRGLLGEADVFPFEGVARDAAFTDLEQDGDQDIAVLVDAPVYGIVLFENHGAGGYAVRSTVPLNARYDQIEAAEVNGDGWRDLLLRVRIHGDSPTVVVVEGSGPFTFRPIVAPATSPPFAWHVLGVDLTGDGIDSIVTPNGNEFIVYGWNGADLVELGRSAIEGRGVVRALDLVPGGGDELVVFQNGLRSYAWTGDGFELIQSLDGGSADDAAIVDWDGDGDLDLVITDKQTPNAHREYSRVDVYLQNPEGRFEPAETHELGRAITSLDAGDLDGDGQADLLAYDHSGFTAFVRDRNGLITGLKRLPMVPSWYVVQHMATIDIDGDGQLEILTTTPNPAELHVLRRGSDGAYRIDASLLIGDQSIGDLKLADLDGDDDLDVLLTISTDATPEFVLMRTIDDVLAVTDRFPLNGSGRRFDLADLDLDGDLDLVTAFWNVPRVEFRRNDGMGTFTGAGALATAPLNGVAVGHFNGDAFPDVAALTTTHRVTLLPGDGDFGFGPPVDYPVHAGGTIPMDIEAADLNEDGFDDVVMTSYSSGSTSGIGVLLADRRGGFLPAAAYECPSGASELAIADVDGDGILDVVVGQWIDDSVSVFHGAGDGSLVEPKFIATPSSGYGIPAVADLDGDGRMEILVGGGTPTIVRPLTCAIGDLDANGIVDAVDLDELLDAWGPCAAPCPADLDGDGNVAFTDLLVLLAAWNG